MPLPTPKRGVVFPLLHFLTVGSATCFQSWIPAHNYVEQVRLRPLPVCVPPVARPSLRVRVRALRSAADDDLQSLAEKLKQGLNSWKDFDEPEPEAKRAKLQHFMDLTGIKDIVAAETKLEKFGWNVEQAAKDGKTYTQKMAKVLNKKGAKKVKIAIAKAAVARSAELPPPAPASRSGYVCRIAVSKQGRGGKTVTMVNGLEPLPVDEKKALLKKLKSAVAGGGKMSDSGGVEVQGEHAETVLKILIAEGFTNSKVSGGIPKKKKK